MVYHGRMARHRLLGLTGPEVPGQIEPNGVGTMELWTRVEIPASTDEWMAGDRYGYVARLRENSAGVIIAHVAMERSGKDRRYRLDQLKVIDREA